MKFNMNTQTTITLTKEGHKVYANYLAQFKNQKIPAVGEKITMPLWEVAQIFGQDMYCGAISVMFEDNSIDLKVEE